MSEPAEAYNLFTVVQISRATGITRRAVYYGLERVVPTKNVTVQGKETAAWAFQTLPLDWQLRVTRRGVERKYEDGIRYIASMPREPWVPPVAWAQLQPFWREKALKLQKALAPTLNGWYASTAPASQIEQLGLENFQKHMGYTISNRHWRRLIDRSIDRDGGAENWIAPEIYLDDRAFYTQKSSRLVREMEYIHRDLDEIIESTEDRQKPTPEEKKYLWSAVFRHYEKLSDALTDSPKGNRKRHRIKASLLCYLSKAFPPGTLCGSAKSLRRRFEEKIIQWREGNRNPEALQDRRCLTSGNFCKSDFTADLKKIRNRAIELSGNESLAYRELRERGELSDEFCKRYRFAPRDDKSNVPLSVRDKITPDVEMCLPLLHGPWEATMRGPYTPRDWSGVRPGDWFCADDVTWNHYFRVRLADGGWGIMRGECLLMNDLRTGYPLEFLLIPGKYNGEHIRNLALKVHDKVGLPRMGYYFEQGVWASRLVSGDRRRGMPVPWRETESGLRGVGMQLEVRHATTPRAKPIEGLLLILQNKMKAIPGFVGFNEQTDCYERMQDLLARARRGELDAVMQFPTMTDWVSRITSVLNDFARDPQNGKMLDGYSPSEAWANEFRTSTLKKLPNEARYILSTHRKYVTVRQEGILIKVRGIPHLYYNGHTGRIIGRPVLAFYNIELPELLTVYDRQHKEYFSVQEVEASAMTALPEQLDAIRQLKKAHRAYAKGIFSELKPEVISTVVRDAEYTEEEKKFGEFHNRENEIFNNEKKEADNRLRKLQTEATKAHVPQETVKRYPSRAEQAIDMRKKADKLRQTKSESQHGLENT